MDSKKKAALEAYKKAYYYYSRGFYSACITECENAEIKMPDNHIALKFKYLKALSAAGSMDKKCLIARLEKFKKIMPGLPKRKMLKKE